MGSCLGANGTMIGASANVVIVGMLGKRQAIASPSWAT
jgi:Na+/H+ antiporter NhaD/arsenite permease-like protein